MIKSRSQGGNRLDSPPEIHGRFNGPHEENGREISVTSTWWFGTCCFFFSTYSPTDFHIFQRGWNHQPDIWGRGLNLSWCHACGTWYEKHVPLKNMSEAEAFELSIRTCSVKILLAYSSTKTLSVFRENQNNPPLSRKRFVLYHINSYCITSYQWEMDVVFLLCQQIPSIESTVLLNWTYCRRFPVLVWWNDHVDCWLKKNLLCAEASCPRCHLVTVVKLLVFCKGLARCWDLNTGHWGSWIVGGWGVASRDSWRKNYVSCRSTLLECYSKV